MIKKSLQALNPINVFDKWQVIQEGYAQMWFEGVRKTLETGKTLPLETEQGLLGLILGSERHCKGKINFDKLPAL